MKKFEKLEDLYDYVSYIKDMQVTDTTIKEISSFSRISPERLANKFDLDKLDFVKKFNKIKKEINFKLITYNNINRLKNRTVEKIHLSLNNNLFISKSCICTKLLEIKYMHKTIRFYPTIEYQYINSSGLIIYTSYKHVTKLYITNDEFKEHFLDIREYKINQILE